MGKKRVILIVGYNGTGYHGSQINKEEKTIEKKICDEIAALQYFNPRNCEDYTKTGLQRSSRTDKGVHAAMLIFSLKVETGPGRSTGQLERLLKESLLPYGITLHALLETTKGFDAKNRCESRAYEYFVPAGIYARETDSAEDRKARFALFKYALEKMQGTHDFHNFTLQNQTKGTMRYICSIGIGSIQVEDREWHRITIHGQSFMIHQIRKMIGLALLFAYKHIKTENPAKYMDCAFGKEKVNIPKAPAALLLLSHSVFTNYNTKYGDLYGKIDSAICSEYKTNTLYPLVCTPEHADLFIQWYSVLEKHKEEFTYLD